MTTIDTTTAGSMKTPPLLNLPTEILVQILTYYYCPTCPSTTILGPPSSISYFINNNYNNIGPISAYDQPSPHPSFHASPTSWSIIIHDPLRNGSRISGIPLATPLLVNRALYNLASVLERVLFSGHLIFTTSSTHWQIISQLRLPSVAPSRIVWFLDHIHTLRFCSPPLFTSRIPWTELPALKVVELDYCHRKGINGNFRLKGVTIDEILSGECDESIYTVAVDSARFDRPVIEDAVVKRVEVRVLKEMSGVSGDEEVEQEEDDGWARDPGHESMLTTTGAGTGGMVDLTLEKESFRVKVIARYGVKGEAQIAFRVQSPDLDTKTCAEEHVIWTSNSGLRKIRSTTSLRGLAGLI